MVTVNAPRLGKREADELNGCVPRLTAALPELPCACCQLHFLSACVRAVLSQVTLSGRKCCQSNAHYVEIFMDKWCRAVHAAFG